MVSALAYYCPLFGELDYLPAIVFPFVKLFSADDISCFEIILSFLN